MNAAFHRRQFLETTDATVAAVSLIGWDSVCMAAPGKPETGASGFTVIDTHTHFYDPARPEGVPWPPREEKRLYCTVLPKGYRILSLQYDCPNFIGGLLIAAKRHGHIAWSRSLWFIGRHLRHSSMRTINVHNNCPYLLQLNKEVSQL